MFHADLINVDEGAHHNPFQNGGVNPFGVRARADTIAIFADEISDAEDNTEKLEIMSKEFVTWLLASSMQASAVREMPNLGSVYERLNTPFRNFNGSVSPQVFRAP